MQSISVKVNDSVQTIAEAKVITKDGQPTVIRATRNANYELINDATGRGPDHIVTKRVGKDLHISFEENAEESDLIIENFYDHDKSALIGQAESGQYHYYVPDTGLTQDYVTELVIGDIEGQALGGQGYPAPWWIGAEEGSRFGIMPWLVGIAGLAGIAAAISGRDDKGNDNNNNANASAQEKPLNIENIQSDTVAQGATQALNFTVTSNGQNVSQAIISVNGTELKDANNKTVLTDKDGKVNITAQLLEANGIKLGELPNFTISAKKEHYTEAKATLHNPEVVTMDGGVVVTPHESATELEVTYTKPGQTVSTTAKFTKNTNGNGKAAAWIDNDETDSVTIDPATGKVVIPVNTIGSKTNVTAKQTTDVGTTNNSKGVSDILSAKPVVEAIKTGDDAGDVVVTPSDDATDGSTVVVNYTDKDGNDKKVTITKDQDGWKADGDLPEGVTLDKDSGTVTIPSDNVTDGSDVTATQTDPGREESDLVSDKARTNVPQPEITANDDGSVTVTPSDKADKVVINYTDEDGNDKTATVTKDNNGNWTSDDDNVVINNDGTITLPDDKVKDGSEVSANQTIGDKDSDKGTVTTQDNVPAPEITANDDGSVTVTPSDKANKVTINYTDEDGKQNTATIAKDNNGKWTSNDDKVVIGNDGSITIPADKVKDGSTATAEQTVGTKDSGKVPVVVNNQNGTTPAKPASPEINANDDGSVTVTPSDKANKVTINYTDEDGKQNTATIAKDNNGKWTSNDDKVVIGNDGNITIPADKVKDGSKVTAQQTTPVGISDPADATAKDGIAEPDVTANPDGSVTVKPAKDATKAEISYVDEDNKEQTVTVTKDKDGNWTADDDNVVINDDGTITLPADKVKDGSDVTANQTTNNGKSGDSSATVADAPSNTFKPTTGADDITITVAGDGIVNKDEADKDTVPVTVKVTPKNGETVTDVKVRVNNKDYPATKGADDNYTAQVPSADIKADKDQNVDAKVGLTKDGKTGTVTDKESYTVDTDAPTVNATRQPDNSVTGTTEPNTAITDKDGKPITDANGKPIVSDDKGKFTIPADKVPSDNTIGAKDKAGNVGTGNVNAPSNTFKPTTGADDITITVAGDGIVNKDEADKDTVPVTVKVTPKNGETVTDVKVRVNNKDYPATKGADDNYTAQVPSADIKADKDQNVDAKVGLTKDGKTGTVTDKESYTVDTDAPTVNATRQPDNSVTGTTEPNTAITDKDGKPITDANGKPIVSDAKGKFTIPADKVPSDNTIGAKDKAGNVGTGNVNAPSNTFKPTTGADDITITVAGDGIVNKDEADKDTVPVTVKVTPKNGETVTDVKVRVNNKDYPATKGADDNYTAQVPSADIKADKDQNVDAKVGLTKDGKTGTVTDKESYTVDTDAPTVNATRQPDNSVTGTTEPNTAITDKDGKPITDANGKPIVSDAKGKFTIPADKVPSDNTIGAKDKAGNVGTGNVNAPSNTFKPTTGADDITITVAGDGIVNKDEADKDTVPVTVKVTPKNGETVTDVKVRVNNKDYPATKGADDNYTAQVPSADIKADKDQNVDAKVGLTKDGKTGTVTDKESYTVDTDAPTVNATRQPDNSVTGTTEPNTAITDKDGKPITDANGKPIVSDAKGKFTIPADKVPSDNTIGAKDKAGNVGTGNVNAPSNTFKPTTGADDITITVAGDGIVNKDEADKDTVPVTVKVTPKNGETVTDVKVRVNNKDYPATKGADDNYTAQVPSADIKADKDQNVDAKVGLTKDGKTGTVTDKESYTVDTDAPTVNATRQPDNSVTGTTEPNTAITDKDGKPITDANGKPIVSDAKGKFTIPADKVPSDNTIGAKDKAGNVGTGNVNAPSNTFKPTTGADDITITVAGDGIVNKDEADKDTVPVTVKVTPKNGETVTDVKVRVNNKDYPATKGADDNYTAQVPSADIKADKDQNVDAKVGLTKDGKTGTVTDKESYTVDTDAPAKPTTPDMTAQTDTGVSSEDNNTNNNKPSFTVQTPADGETPVLMVDGNPVEAEVTKNNGTTTLTPKQSIPDGDHKVSVAVTDPAGNTSKSSELPITIDTEAPTKPKVTIGENGDRKITDNELDANGDVTITVGLPGDAKAGDTVVINDDDDKGIELTDDHIKAGKVEVKVKAPGDGIDLAADVLIKDKAGNRSESDSETAQREVAKPNAPTIELVKDTTRKGFPDGGKDFVTNTNGVKISSDAKDATIEYRLNGGKWKTYDGKPITLPENNKSKGVTTKIETKQTVNGKESEVHEQSITIDKKAGLSAGIEKGKDGNYYITGIAEKGSVLKFSGQNVNGKTLTVTNDDGSFRLPIGKNLTTNVDRTIQVTDKAGNESSVHFTSHEYGNINTTGISGVKPEAVNAATSGKNDYILIGSGGGYGDISSSLVWANDKVNTQGGDDTIVAYSKITSVTGKVEVDMGAGNDTLRVGNNVYGNSNTSTKILMGDGDDNVVIGDTALQANPHTEKGNSISGGVFDLGSGDDTMSVYAGISSGAMINGGAGNDVLSITHGSGRNHTAEVGLQSLKNIEMVDLTGVVQGKDNLAGSLTNVTFSNVLDGSQGIYVRGNQNDTVDIGKSGSKNKPTYNDEKGTWIKGSSTEVDGHTYDVWTNTADNKTATVYIEQGINVI